MPSPFSSTDEPSADDWISVAPWPIHLVDVGGRPFGPNPALATLLGFAPRQFDEELLRDATGEKSRRRLAEVGSRLSETARRRYAETSLSYRHRDGTTVKARNARVGPLDRPTGSMLVMLQGLEPPRTLSRSDVQSRLARLIAHEFNNIFTVAKSYVDLARRQQPTAGLAANYLQRAAGAIRRGIAANERLQIVALDKDLPMEDCAVDDVVSMIRPFLPRLMETGPRWSLFCQPDLPILRSHIVLLARFVLDFILNAHLRWSHAEQLELELRRSPGDKPAVIGRVAPPDEVADALPVEFRPFLSSRKPLLPTNTDPLFVEGILEGHPISIDATDNSLTALLPADG